MVQWYTKHFIAKNPTPPDFSYCCIPVFYRSSQTISDTVITQKMAKNVEKTSFFTSKTCKKWLFLFKIVQKCGFLTQKMPQKP